MSDWMSLMPNIEPLCQISFHLKTAMLQFLITGSEKLHILHKRKS